MASSSTYAFFHCHYAFQKFPFFCVTLCVLHALQNATESHSAFWSFPILGRPSSTEKVHTTPHTTTLEKHTFLLHIREDLFTMRFTVLLTRRSLGRTPDRSIRNLDAIPALDTNFNFFIARHVHILICISPYVAAEYFSWSLSSRSSQPNTLRMAINGNM